MPNKRGGPYSNTHPPVHKLIIKILAETFVDVNYNPYFYDCLW